VVIGVLCALSCALLGNFLVLRRMSMMGDAISHAVLPGLAVAFLISGSRASIPMFFGAAAVGVCTALFTQWVHSFGRVERGAAMGVVFTTLFALGLLLIVRAADHVDLDPGCVLYGAIELAPLEVVTIGSWSIPQAAIVLTVVLALNATFVALFFKELRISAFDPALATTLGINARLMHYLLMTLVAVTTVACFESIGSILVIAMLIVPPAAAHLLTDRLSSMVLVSLAVAACCAVLGHLAAITVPTWLGYDGTTTSGMMATMAGVIFAAVMLLAPRHGVLSQLLHRGALRLRIAKEDVLGLLYRLEEIDAGPPRLDVIRRTVSQPTAVVRLAVARLRGEDKIVLEQGGHRLTDSGRRQAVDLVRTHRLWESFLHQHLPLAADHLHDTAERLEHVTDPAMQERLAEATDRPTHDPHGKAIPKRSG